MLSIRGLSDIVGHRRQDAWTKYACASAAAFTRGYLRTQPMPVAQTPEPDVGVASALRRGGSGEKPDHQAADEEECFSNLAMLRLFPETLYVAPALSKSRTQSWLLLNQDGSGKSTVYIPGAWTLHEGNLYSFVDPERSRLKTIIDIGGLDQFSTQEWAFSDNENKRRLFVHLLNSALREDLWCQGVRYHGDQDVYAFMGRSDEPPRRLKYANVKIHSTATVVSHYETKPKNGKAYKYLRHAAFQGRFRWLGEQWYLEITPTYRFTHNGRDLDRYHESLRFGHQAHRAKPLCVEPTVAMAGGPSSTVDAFRSLASA